MKRKTISLIVTASLISGFCMTSTSISAAEQEVYPLSLAAGYAYNWNWSDEYNVTLNTVKYPGIYLMNGYETSFSALSATLDAVNEYRLNNAMTAYDNLSAFASESVGNYDMEEWVPYSSSDDMYVRRADSSVLSLMYINTTEYSELEKSQYYWGENYNSVTGQLIPLSEVVTDFQYLSDVVSDYLFYYYPDTPFYSEYMAADYFANMEEINIPWTLEQTGITFYFNPYDIADAEEHQIVTIPFDAFPDLFTGAYIQSSDNYCVTLAEDQTFYYDFDNDGEQDYLYVCGVKDEYGSYIEQDIYLNGAEYTEEMYVYDIKPVLVHMADGHNYLYVQNLLDNDYRQIGIYDLSDGTVQYKDVIYSRNHAYPEFEAYITEDVLTDPTYYFLDTVSHVLGTNTATKLYHTGEDGIPVSDDPWYEINGFYNTLTLKQNLDADLLDYNTGESQGTITLYAGGTVSLLRTDMESFVDLLAEDGSVCRVSVDVSSWPQYVNGMEAEQVFDGMMYAG